MLCSMYYESDYSCFGPFLAFTFCNFRGLEETLVESRKDATGYPALIQEGALMSYLK